MCAGPVPLSRKGSDPLLYGFVVPEALLFLGSLFRWHRAHSKFLIVSGGEVRIFNNNIETNVIPLDPQTDARWDWVTGRITFRRSGTEIGAFVPGSRRLGRVILGSIEQRRSRQVTTGVVGAV